MPNAMVAPEGGTLEIEIALRQGRGEDTELLDSALHVVKDAKEEASKVNRNANFTAIGKRKKIAAKIRQAFEAIDGPHEERMSNFDRMIGELRAEATAAPKPSAEDILVHREIRDLMRKKHTIENDRGEEILDTTMIEAAYHTAARNGDEQFTRALEGAPQFERMISAEARQKADDVRVERSKHFERLQELTAHRNQANSVRRSARLELNELAERFDVADEVLNPQEELS